MKRHVITFVIALTPVLFQAQELIDTIVPVSDDGLIEYMEVFHVEGTSAELYERAEEWVKDYFPNPSSIFRERKPEEDYMAGNIRLRIYEIDKKGNKGTMFFVVHFDFRFEFKDGRFRVILTDFTRKSQSDYPLERWIDPQNPYFKEKNIPYLVQVDEEVLKLLESLENAMQPVEEEADDW